MEPVDVNGAGRAVGIDGVGLGISQSSVILHYPHRTAMKHSVNSLLVAMLVASGCNSKPYEVGMAWEDDDMNELSTGSLDAEPTGFVFGGPSDDSIFAPYQGRWRFADRVIDPPPTGATISGGPDINVKGHIVRFGSDTMQSEMRLCLVRSDGEGLVAEGWFHEDIYDPGDMQRVDVYLQRSANELHMKWRKRLSENFSDDPIIAPSDFVPSVKPDDPHLPWWIETYTRLTDD